jgi:hypothetical protein
MSAHLCLIAWYEPIGRPNCSRVFGVVGGHLEAALRAAHLLGGQRRDRERERALEVRGLVAARDEPRGRRRELDRRELARGVERRNERAREPLARASTRNRPSPSSVRAATSSTSADVAVEHPRLRAVELEAVALRARAHRDARDVPAAVRLGVGERHDLAPAAIPASSSFWVAASAQPSSALVASTAVPR